MKIRTISTSITILLAVLFLLACSSSEDSINNSQGYYENPFEYCKAVGTIDTPGSEYTGAKLPDVIAQELRKDMRVSDTMPKEMFECNWMKWSNVKFNIYS